MDAELLWQLLLSWLPIIVMTIGAYGLALSMCRRKGVSWFVCLQVFIPAWGYYFLYWLVSRPDVELLRRIEALEQERAAQ